ncbi:MAG: hypothetical protein A3G49_03355 [Candidatus Sungbacteria bacterium RIFCSPLOWO2_12_FULL_41_11]|uniref:Type IV pilus modification protein PilV n=1 Tax=Candidatus Sungbacteria bacterium RIFCSPLOWO2_12_FULL_41_11 TaxID=1802286 RepID=A0A1G2LT60_9BACT|nr:MAG: hypothetical protein UV01_C0015G0024 [Parcubacteria group bacterium GW2011_GWA2_42_14]OGZ98298.1 MAG: hypothetical protein A3D41_04150 [Candidatus Sungbacteria bacterium RIFCSPHIGHO2_02_FULL_41_12b]OHA14743.1 MAG: hypothetical protein A3G49_03355 [Candidatus Sungbacteria bacterium RIFCSPLOWO2_12_FULL_41_11]
MRGVSLIEVIIGATIISIILLALGSIAQFSIGVSKVSTERLQAVFLASETIEALKTMRDSNWTTRIAPLAAGTSYYLLFVGDHYETTTVQPALIDGKFNRYFILENVNRDPATNDISASGTNDPDTKLVKAVVEWTSKSVIKTETVKTYIMNIFNN